MVTQQLTMTADDVSRLKLNRFAVPGTARCLTYNVDCNKVNVVVSIDQLGIQAPVVAMVVPEEVVDLDPPERANDGQQSDVQIKTQLPDDIAELRRMLQEAVSDLYESRRKVDTVTMGSRDDRSTLTLHQIKLRALDESLARVRKQLQTARQTREFLDRTTEDSEVVTWLLRQENELRSEPQSADNIENVRQSIALLETQRMNLSSKYGEQHPSIISLDRQIALWKNYLTQTARNQPPLSTEEWLRRYRVRLDHKTARLQARFDSLNEEFRFHFAKAKKLEKLERRQNELQRKIVLLKSRIIDLELARQVSESQKQSDLLDRYRQAAIEYQEIRSALREETAFQTYADEPSVHHRKIRELDAALAAARESLTTTGYFLELAEKSQGGDDEMIATNVQVLVEYLNVLSDDSQLPPSEMLQRCQLLLQRQKEKLDSQINADTERFRFHYSGAKNIDVLNQRLQNKLEEIDLIEAHLDEATQKQVRKEYGIESQDRRPKESDQLKAMTDLLIDIMSNVDPPASATFPDIEMPDAWNPEIAA